MSQGDWIEDYFVTDEQWAALDVWKTENPLRVWREQNGLKIEDVAKAVGIGTASLMQYEMGHRRIPDYRLVILANEMKSDDLMHEWRRWEMRCPIKNQPMSNRGLW